MRLFALAALVLLLGEGQVSAQAPPRPRPTINSGSAEYTYLGCYEETIALANTSHLRALHGGKDQVGGGRMTVPLCLGFCGGDGDGVKYEFAGLEYSR